MIAPPTTSYLICATPRTGSYLLCEALTHSGVAGRPAEYFWRDHEPFWAKQWGTQNYRDYVAAAIREATTPNGVFGAKLMWEYMDDLTGKLRNLTGHTVAHPAALLTEVFGNPRYIWIRRRDKVRQAVSNWRAIQSGVWMVKDKQPMLALERYDFEAIDALVRKIAGEEAAWERFFREAGIVPYPVIYEEFIQAYQETALAIIRHLGIPIPSDLRFQPRHLRQQADTRSEEWVQRYRYDAGQQERGSL